MASSPLRQQCPVCAKSFTDPTRVWCVDCDSAGMTLDAQAAVERLRPADRPRQMALLARQEFLKCAADPMYWLDASRHMPTGRWPNGLPYVFTLDPHTMFLCAQCADGLEHNGDKLISHLRIRHNLAIENPLQAATFFTRLPSLRPFPIFPYTEPIVSTWLRSYLFAMEKSRDMSATWLMVALHSHGVLFHDGLQYIFQSKVSADAAELVQRAFIIYDNQPKFLKAQQRATYTEGKNKSGVMKVAKTGSEILGFPQGAHQIRQYHPSGLFQDEAAFQPEAAAAFASAKPAIQNGGRYSGISSANPGWWQAVCQDTLEDWEGEEEIPFDQTLRDNSRAFPKEREQGIMTRIPAAKI